MEMTQKERASLLHRIEHISSTGFEMLALDVFQYQAAYNPLYARFLDLLGKKPSAIGSIREIPFLPISFFKSYEIKTGSWTPEAEFTSSTTTGQIPSRHLVRELGMYLEHTRKGFAAHFTNPADYCILALLPSYLERSGSSLVAMAQDWIARSKHPESGFFLHDYASLRARILQCQKKRIPTLLLGVSYALLDFAEAYPMDLEGVLVMETGGMKGKRKELTRNELHEVLCRAFQLRQIYSEYGMTELFSQAYLKSGNFFAPAPTMRARTSEVNDPFSRAAMGKTGVLEFVDLANLDTISFISTEDLGKVYENGMFEVIGRLDAAEHRGCNLMVQ